MGGDFGSDFFTISDEDGNEFELEHIDTIESNGRIYMAFLPSDMDEEDEDYGVVILEVIEEDGEYILSSINDENEQNAIHERFIERLLDE